MQPLTYFAGWPSCTPAQESQKSLAIMVSVGLFASLCAGWYFLFKRVARSNVGFGLKVSFYSLLTVLALPVCIGLPFLAGIIMTPWCT